MLIMNTQLDSDKHPPIEVTIPDTARNFLVGNCWGIKPEQRPTAKELLNHPFITEVDPTWSFAESEIGKVVAKKGSKAIKATPL